MTSEVSIAQQQCIRVAIPASPSAAMFPFQHPFCITCFLGKGRAEQVGRGRGGASCNALCMLYKSPSIVTLECRYSSLRTNLPRQIMSFSDFPFIPEVMGDQSHDSRRFPSHTEVQAWLEVFAAKFQLRQHIKFNSQIVSLRPITSAALHSSSELPASVKTAPRWKLTVQTAAFQQAAQRAEQAPHATKANSTQSQAEPADPAADNDSLTADVGASLEVSSTPAEADDSASHHPDSNGSHSRHDHGKQKCSRHDSTSNGCSSRTSDQHAHAHSSHTQPGSEQQDSAESRRAAESHSGPSGCTEYDFDAVVVCVGNYHQPNLPEIKGMDDFKGLQMHAHNYRSKSMFAGMQVIVVGASFSGACYSLVSIMPVSGTHQNT